MSKTASATARNDAAAGGLLKITPRGEGSRFSLRAKPRASRAAVVGVREGVLDVAITAPPVDGAANDELVALIAKALRVRRQDVAIVAGSTGRSKVVEVSLSAELTQARFTDLLEAGREK